MSLLSDNRRWDSEADLLVVGAGAAGMTAALVGALEGLKTVLWEKSDMVGGTTATSAGTVWIPGSRQSKTAGVPDSIEFSQNLSCRDTRRGCQRRPTGHVSRHRPLCSRLPRRTNQRSIYSTVRSSRLPRAARCRGRRQGSGRRAVRRAKVGSGFCTGEATPPRLSCSWRHDGRQKRHSVTAPSVRTLWKILQMRRGCWRGRRVIGSIISAGRGLSWGTHWLRGCSTA